MRVCREKSYRARKDRGGTFGQNRGRTRPERVRSRRERKLWGSFGLVKFLVAGKKGRTFCATPEEATPVQEPGAQSEERFRGGHVGETAPGRGEERGAPRRGKISRIEKSLKGSEKSGQGIRHLKKEKDVIEGQEEILRCSGPDLRGAVAKVQRGGGEILGTKDERD